MPVGAVPVVGNGLPEDVLERDAYPLPRQERETDYGVKVTLLVSAHPSEFGGIDSPDAAKHVLIDIM